MRRGGIGGVSYAEKDLMQTVASRHYRISGVPAPSHSPFVPDSASLDEFTLRAVVMGALLGMLFGASSLYLVLKVGLTVSASIPVAVIAIALFRLASKAGVRDSTILENNIVQTEDGGEIGRAHV